MYLPASGINVFACNCVSVCDYISLCMVVCACNRVCGCELRKLISGDTKTKVMRKNWIKREE